MNSDEWSIADDPGQPQLVLGAQIGPYRLEAQLGEGGMGTVYRALDTKLNRPDLLPGRGFPGWEILGGGCARRGPGNRQRRDDGDSSGWRGRRDGMYLRQSRS